MIWKNLWYPFCRQNRAFSFRHRVVKMKLRLQQEVSRTRKVDPRRKGFRASRTFSSSPPMIFAEASILGEQGGSCPTNESIGAGNVSFCPPPPNNFGKLKKSKLNARICSKSTTKPLTLLILHKLSIFGALRAQNFTLQFCAQSAPKIFDFFFLQILPLPPIRNMTRRRWIFGQKPSAPLNKMEPVRPWTGLKV